MKRQAALLVLAGLAALSAPGGGAAAAEGGTCSRAAVAAAGAAVRAARSELSAIPPGEGDTSVPPAAGRLIERAKDGMRALVEAEMACAPASPDPAMLTANLAAGGDGFAAAPDAAEPRPDDARETITYRVERVEGHPDMLAAVATLRINCGTDSMLMLYRRERGRWRELMVRRAIPYGEVRGGWQDLRFAVSPPDRDGRWFVATVSTTPWCSSSWQGLRYALARPSADPARPSVFFDAKTTTWLGSEEELLLRAERDAFELRHVAASIDPAVHNRRHVRRYAVAGETVRRIPPVAESVRDFVDEWIGSPWAEARHWSGSDPALARLHAQLQAGRYELLGEFASIRGCGNGVTQVEMSADDGPGWYFLARGGESGPWTLERVGRRAEARCRGPDRLTAGP